MYIRTLVAIGAAALFLGVGNAGSAVTRPTVGVLLTVNPNPSMTGQQVTFHWQGYGITPSATCDDNMGWLVGAPYVGSITKVAGVDFTTSFTWRVSCADDFSGAHSSFDVTYYDTDSQSWDADHYAVQVTMQEAQQEVSADGLAVEPGSTLIFSDSTRPRVCYSTIKDGHALSSTFGIFLSKQIVYEDRVWCGTLNGTTYYRASRVRGGNGGGGICSGGDPKQNVKVGGGVGYFSTDVKTGEHFTCTASGNSLFFDDWQIWRCNMAGWCNHLRQGRD